MSAQVITIKANGNHNRTFHREDSAARYLTRLGFDVLSIKLMLECGATINGWSATVRSA